MKPLQHLIHVFAISGSALLLSSTSVYAAEEVNIYSARKTDLIQPLLDVFSKESGIKVNLVTGGEDELIKRLEVEGKASPADLLITVDAGRLHRAKVAGVLQSVESDVLSKTIPAHLRDADNQWFGISLRARPIFYVKGKVDPAQLSRYEALADDQWKGRICIRSSGNIYNQSLVGSMIEADGLEATEAWAKKFVANFARPPAGGDTDQLKAAAAGVCDIAIANTYYYGRLVKSTKADDNAIAAKLGVFWPNQGDRGAHVNVSGVGITQSAKHKANAIKLMEFLVSPEAQAWYAKVNNEYPIISGGTVDSVLKSWGDFKRDDIALTQLGVNNRKAVELMDRAGWK
jgi:iron(III) transport system substrate-binding protein